MRITGDEPQSAVSRAGRTLAVIIGAACLPLAGVQGQVSIRVVVSRPSICVYEPFVVAIEVQNNGTESEELHIRDSASIERYDVAKKAWRDVYEDVLEPSVREFNRTDLGAGESVVLHTRVSQSDILKDAGKLRLTEEVSTKTGQMLPCKAAEVTIADHRFNSIAFQRGNRAMLRLRQAYINLVPWSPTVLSAPIPGLGRPEAELLADCLVLDDPRVSEGIRTVARVMRAATLLNHAVGQPSGEVARRTDEALAALRGVSPTTYKAECGGYYHYALFWEAFAYRCLNKKSEARQVYDKIRTTYPLDLRSSLWRGVGQWAKSE